MAVWQILITPGSIKEVRILLNELFIDLILINELFFLKQRIQILLTPFEDSQQTTVPTNDKIFNTKHSGTNV